MFNRRLKRCLVFGFTVIILGSLVMINKSRQLQSDNVLIMALHSKDGLVTTGHSENDLMKTRHSDDYLVKTRHFDEDLVGTSHSENDLVETSHSGNDLVRTSHSGNDLELGHGNGRNFDRLWLIYDNDSPDICGRLREWYPDWTIVLTGLRPTRSLTCAYYFIPKLGLERSKSTIQLLKLIIKEGARTVYVANDPFNDGLVLRNPKCNWESRRSIVYDSMSSTENFYDPTLTWACGAIRNNAERTTVPYKICLDMDVGMELVIPKHSKDPVDTTCDAIAPSVILSPETYTNIYQKGILFHSNAIWAVPVLYFDDSDRLVYSIIVQKMLWLMNSHIKVRTAQHLDSYNNGKHSNDLVTTLKTNNCPKSATTFIQCFEILLDNISKNLSGVTRNSWVFADWFSLLKTLAYTFPSVQDIAQNRTCLNNTLRRLVGDKSSVKLNYDIQSRTGTTLNNAYVSQNLLRNVCSDIRVRLETPPVHVFTDVLLVVTFNRASYLSVPYVEALYRKLYPHIVYCAPADKDHLNFGDALKGLDLSFVFYKTNPQNDLAGTYYYECNILAASMGYDVKGYFVISDDVLISPSKMKTYDKDKVWYLDQKYQLIGNLTTNKQWRVGFNDKMDMPSRSPFKRHRNVLKHVMTKLHEMTSKHARFCVQRLVDITGSPDRPLNTISDAVYYPASKMDAIGEVMGMFFEENMYIVEAITMVADCVVAASDYINLRPLYILGIEAYGLPIYVPAPGKGRRNFPWVWVNQSNIHDFDFFHPYKLSYVHKRDKPHVDFFCAYSNFLHDPHEVFNSTKS